MVDEGARRRTTPMPPWVSGTTFEGAVHAVVASVLPGQVVTYGEVAAEAGRPGAARAVGRIMATSDGALAWWRVVTATGRLVPGLEDEHRRRLQAEGVEVDERGVRAVRERRNARGRHRS